MYTITLEVNIPCNLLIKLADIFHVPVDILIYEEKNNLFSSQGEELWEIYKQLDEANKDGVKFFL